ncbi:MAG: ferric reductase-like transmembrane domain-containing protein [Chitinispirillaceae bacterium]|nr:ferric reductase-like transmembrane domain-containing protein [Chitinispirillaceae bacterium]
MLDNYIGDLKSLRQKKRGLQVFILLTSVAPLFWVNPREQTLTLNLLLVFAKIGSLCGTILLCWQFLLGYRRYVSTIITDLIWVVTLHKRLGIAAIILITLHPVCITAYYYRKYSINLFNVNTRYDLGLFVIIGIVAFLILLLLLFTSVIFRKQIDKWKWYILHLSSYLLIPLLFIHSITIGMTLLKTSLRGVWFTVFGLMGALYVSRILFRLGIFSRKYRIARVRPETASVVDITMAPDKGAIKPAIGQFIYIYRYSIRGARPYTISDYNTSSRELLITAKAQGVTSTALQTLHEGEVVWLDGPYGIFSWEALSSGCSLVMIAGGIGITPFRRIIKLLESVQDRDAWLFYGCNTIDEIVFRKELQKLKHVKVVYVIAKEELPRAERGFVTTDIINKYIDGNPADFEYLLCGPPVMILTLELQLRNLGIAPGKIHHELFSW